MERIATTRILRKILNVINNSKEPLNMKEIAKATGYRSQYSYINDGLLFLCSVGLVKKETTVTSVKKYSKPKKLPFR